jgi:2-iminobutanoate/2-iminopropanoate deaminase
MTRQAITTSGAPAAIGPYSQAIAAGELVFCSGQVGLDPTTGELVGDGVEAQAERALKNLGAVLDAAGLGFGDVVKVTIFLADIGDFATVNAVYGRFMTDRRSPSRRCRRARGSSSRRSPSGRGPERRGLTPPTRVPYDAGTLP